MSERGNDALSAFIANGASLSGVVPILGRAIVGILLPATWTAAAITFSASPDDITYGDLYDDGGTEVTIASASVVAGRFITNATILEKLASARYVKIRSGTTGTPVNQGAARTLILSLKA